MQPDHDQSNQAIGRLLANAKINAVKAVLQDYDHSKSKTFNLAVLSSNNHTREHILDTIKYLESYDANMAPLLVITPNKRNKKAYMLN